MSVSSVSNDSGILREEYLEQQRKLQQQRQQADATAQSAEDAASRANADTAGADQGASSSAVSVKAAPANAGTAATAGTDNDTTDNQALISKANSGVALNSSELSTLKQVDPALYARVIKAQKAREEVRNQLTENPSNAAQITKNAILKNTSGDEDTRNLIDRTLVDEYKNFASKYDQVIISGR